jgi:uncharacterized RDD family membrane protein YckC
LAESVKEYLNARIELVKLNVAEKSSEAMANVIAGVFVALVFFLFILFAGIALSIGLGAWIGNRWLGFLIVSLLYLVICLIIWFARGKIIRLPIMNAIIKQLFRNDDEED